MLHCFVKNNSADSAFPGAPLPRERTACCSRERPFASDWSQPEQVAGEGFHYQLSTPCCRANGTRQRHGCLGCRNYRCAIYKRLVARECHERPVSKKGLLHSPYIARLCPYPAPMGRWRVGSAGVRQQKMRSALCRQRGTLKSVKVSLTLL
jgi:hypothetical protein